MKHIYLDQNKWIDLAAAAKGLQKGERYRDVLTLAEAGVDPGFLSFPLASIHYIETTNRRPWEARRDLANTMGVLSRFHTIAPLNVLVPSEIDRALKTAFGKPLVPRDAQIFGVGAAHALNQKLRTYRVPDDLDVDSEYKRLFNNWAAIQTEWVMLAGLPSESGIDEHEMDSMQRDVGARLAKEQETLRKSRRDEGWHAGERAKRVANAAAFAGWNDELTEALEEPGSTGVTSTLWNARACRDSSRRSRSSTLLRSCSDSESGTCQAE